MVKNSMVNQENKCMKLPERLLCYSITAALVGMFFFLFFSQMPIGDDILFMFKNSIFLYLDGYSFSTSAGLVSSLHDVMAEIAQQYMTWHARIIPKLLYYFCMSVSPWLSGIVDMSVMVLICLFTTSIIKNCSFFEAFCQPIWILYVGIVVIWYSPGIAYIRMQMFLFMYALPLLFYIIYYKLHRNLLASNYNASTKNIVLLTVVGICAGSMHEVFGVYPIVMISFEILILSLQKRIPFQKLLYHSGYLIGYLSCVLAPGNFNRIGQAHESRNTGALMAKLNSSISAHKTAIMGNGTMVAKVFLASVLIVVAIAFILRLRRIGIKRASAEAFGAMGQYFVTFLASILIWTLFGYMPTYAEFIARMVFYTAFAVYISNVVTLEKIMVCNSIKYGFCTALLLFFALQNGPWLYHETKITQERRRIINDGKTMHYEEVVVPKYRRDGNYGLYNYTNNANGEFDTGYYRAYYGLHIVIDDTEE